MTPRDKARFAAMLLPLASLFDRELGEDVARLYFEALRGYDLPVVAAAIATVAKTARFFPKPADIIDAIEGPAEDRAAFQFAQCLLKMRYKPHEPIDAAAEDAIRLMGGWGRIDALTYRGVEPVEIASTRKEFMQLYRVATTRQAFVALPGGQRALRGETP